MAGEVAVRFILVFVVTFSLSSMAADALSESLEQRIQALENQGLEQGHLLLQQQNDIKSLKKENNEHKLRFIQQERLLNAYIRRVSTLETRVANMEHHGTKGYDVDEASIQETNLGGNASMLDDSKERQLAVDVKGTKRSIMNKERIRSSTENVAFLSNFQGTGMNTIGVDQKVVFPDVSLNIGNGYHNHLGVFIVPKTGVYMLSTSISCEGLTWIEVAIMKNGNSLSTAFAESDQYDHDQGSVTVVTSLNLGDEVWVSSVWPHTTNVYGYGTSSFTGSLLFDM